MTNSVHWLDYGLDDRGSIPDRGRIFFTTFREAVGPIQSPIQLIPADFPRRWSGRVAKLTT